MSQFLTWNQRKQNNLMIAGNRNRIPYITLDATNFMKYYGYTIHLAHDVNLRDFELYCDNFFSVATGGIGTSNCLPFKGRAGFEYPIGGTVYPLSVNGDLNPYIDVGQRVKFTGTGDLVTTADTLARIRIDQEHVGIAAGATYKQLCNTLIAPGRQDHASSGNDNTLIKAHGGVTYPNAGVTTLAYGPTCLLAKPVGAAMRKVFIVSDSIGRGSGDTFSTTQQGDWLSGTSPSTDYPNYGNIGWIERSIGDSLPYYSMAVQGRQAQTFLQFDQGPILAVLDRAPPTDIVLSLGTNDLIGGRTPAALKADIEAIIVALKTRYGANVRIWLATVPPVTNSTDVWATTTNQTFTGILGTTTVTWSNFNGTDETTGRRLWNSMIRSGAVAGAYGYFDVAIAVEDATDPRKWRVDLSGGAATGDGIHPKDNGHKAMAAQANIPTRLAA